MNVLIVISIFFTLLLFISATRLNSPFSKKNIYNKVLNHKASFNKFCKSLITSAYFVSYAEFGHPANALDESVSAVAGNLIRTDALKENLKASDLIGADIDFTINQLKDMLFVLENLETEIDKKDYENIRGVFRQEPLRTLRKTCRSLKKYLPSTEIQEKFESNYQKMISAVDDFDFVATKRFRKDGIPNEGVKDTELLNLLKEIVEKLNLLIKSSAAV